MVPDFFAFSGLLVSVNSFSLLEANGCRWTLNYFPVAMLRLYIEYKPMIYDLFFKCFRFAGKGGCIIWNYVPQDEQSINN